MPEMHSKKNGHQWRNGVRKNALWAVSQPAAKAVANANVL